MNIVLDLIHLMHLYIYNVLWKFETGTVITFVFIQADHGLELCGLCYGLSIGYHNCPIYYPYSLLKFGQSLKACNNELMNE